MAQTYVNKEWMAQSGLPDTIDWSASALDQYGNIIMAGNTLVGPGDPDILVTKTSKEGNLLWQRTYGGAAHGPDYGAAVTVDGSGNVFVAGATTNAGSMLDIVVIKYGLDGGLLWTRTWNGTGNLIDAPSSIRLDAAGAIYVAGITYASLANVNYAVLKLAPSGTVAWANQYDYDGATDIAVGLELDGNNDPVVSGASSASANSWDFATISYNKITGDQVNVSRIPVPGVSLNEAMAFTRDGTGAFFITGTSETGGNKDVQTVRLTPTFGLDWVNTYGGGQDEAPRAIDATAEGQAYVAGRENLSEGGRAMALPARPTMAPSSRATPARTMGT